MSVQMGLATVLMSEAEARACVERIRSHTGRLREDLLDLEAREGWRALKDNEGAHYPNLRACMVAEFGQAERYLYYELAAGRIETRLCTIVQSGPIPEGQLRPLNQLKEPEQQRAAWQLAQDTAPPGGVTAAHVAQTVAAIKEQTPALPTPVPVEQVASKEAGDRTDMYVSRQVTKRGPQKVAKLNRTNLNVDWAWWTWNPVTGCLHDCPYCYARDLANLHKNAFPVGFAPHFHPERLPAPRNSTVPTSDDPRSRRVFTCSMADLFGNWVPQEWIDAVVGEVRDNPQWEFLFLTKFPQRLASIDWPDNAWVGTTVDRQYRVSIAEKAFRGVKAGVKWLSCEPLLEPLKFSSLTMFDWVVIGGQSANSQEPAFQPPWEWIEDLLAQARAAGCQVYFKDNLHNRPQEQPRSVAPQ